ncbi:MAG: transglycosylase domain-containing protein [Streptosporangiaceae bacterium]
MLSSERRAGITTIPRLLILAAAAGLLAAAIALPVVGVFGVATRDAAQTFETLSVPRLGQVPSRSEILDSQGRLLAYYYPGGIDRVPVTYNQISPLMRNAIVAIEDSRFFQHGAFDPRGTFRAVVNDLKNSSGGNVQGGSTLAQQYVKNALILTATTPAEKAAAYADDLPRKIRELRMAAIVEHQLSKQQLLAAYLSVAYFENQSYGVEVAAERYFSVPADKLNLTQSAMLAGMVENPSLYDPFVYPGNAKTRRNTVIARMAQLHYISATAAKAAEATPLGLHPSPYSLQSGCTAQSATKAAFFCDYVLSVLSKTPAYAKAYADLNSTGGLRIYTTLNMADERAASNAVNFVVPPRNGYYNPDHNVDTEVLIQPGTGKVKAIAVDRPYGNGRGHTTVDYAVNSTYDGGAGVQTGSSSKLFTLLTALKKGVPFGFNESVSSPATLTGYYNCHGQSTGPFPVTNAEGKGTGTYTLYNGTTQSINVFYAHLEQKVGLCAVVKTAASLGVRRADGVSLLRRDPHLPAGNNLSADNYPSFTLGSIYVSPMSMADAYATVAARGIYCKPIAITRILTGSGSKLPVESADCHRVISAAVADAANQILQGVLLSPGTASNRGISVPAAAKTGTANGGYYAAFAGYTPRLAGYVSVFNPLYPTTRGAMVGSNACYREVGGYIDCPGQMFGDNAPGATWQMTFQHLRLPYVPFVAVPPGSPFLSAGSGISSPKPPAPPKAKGPAPKPSPGPGGPGGGGGGGGGHGHGRRG